ncbi:VC0807 family protein [Pararhizobium mangrovi]|uniref:Transmembrane protein n=1 Tax=Pararhizobium mangrovi TaxID=2590452 RepID=A0A506U1F8_9HYPH|nr:VC0807 family protein [Pararhizobium mangrovi]TPW26449.1 hypothetical protein FJU11_14705 [Pararhizobium mangrovi]
MEPDLPVRSDMTAMDGNQPPSEERASTASTATKKASDANGPRIPGVLRAHGGGALALVAVNVAAPLLIYDRVAPYASDTVGLIAAGVPPLAWSVVEFACRRRLDAVSMLVLAGIVLSLAAVLLGGSPRLLQLRENLVTALVGLSFLVSAAIGRPLVFELARAWMRRSSEREAVAFEAKRDAPGFRRTMMVMTLVWGAGLLASAAIACWLVFVLSIHDDLIAGPFVGYATMALLALWTMRYARRRRGKRPEDGS